MSAAYDSSGTIFQTTHWTVVLDAAQTKGAAESFSQLYSSYWFPLYAYVRRRGYSRQEAEDLTQDFFVRLIQKRSLAGIEKEGGRFRSFLLRALHNFLANEWDRAAAIKRGSGQRPLSLETDEGEARLALARSDDATPEKLYEQQWTLTLLERVTERLRSQYAADGKAHLFEALRPYLQGDRSGPPYAQTAARYGMTEGAVKVAVHRMRQNFGGLLRAEIGCTVSRPEEIEEELRYLIRVVAQS